MGGLRKLAVIVCLLLAPVIIADELVHTMARGETIYTLSRRYGLSAEQILQYNGIDDPTRIPIGASIRIPGTYVVQRGEYPYAIAQKLGISWIELLEANGLNRESVVQPGDILLVPGEQTTRVAATPDSTTPGSDRADGDRAQTDAASGSANTTATSNTNTTTSASTAAQISWVPGAWPHPGEREAWDGKFPGTAMHGTLGDPFFSVTGGVVEYVGPFSSFGRLILVRGANGYLYGYAGADRVNVSAGERVEAGVELGTLGSASAFEQPTVLFTVWRNNRYVDPETAPRG
jgi:LysM repeat protein